MKKDMTLNNNGSGVVRRANPDRLVDLLSSFSDLRSNNRLLLDQLRGTIDELREIRNSLSRENSPRVPDGEAHTGSAVKNRYGLTRRERQVAKLLAEGRSNQAIARELEISEHTARHHTQSILAKLEVHSRSEAGAKLRGAARQTSNT